MSVFVLQGISLLYLFGFFWTDIQYLCLVIGHQSDLRTHCLLYFGLSQTRGAEINWKNTFFSLSLGGQSLAYWKVLFTKYTEDQSAPYLHWFCWSHGSLRHSLRANNLNLSLFLCKVCSVRFSNEVCLHSQNGVGYLPDCLCHCVIPPVRRPNIVLLIRHEEKNVNKK